MNLPRFKIQPSDAEIAMRLSPRNRQVIRAVAREVFGEEATVRVFGSRVDDQARGGDIDLLVELPVPVADRNRKVLRMVARLQQELGDQRFDVLVVDPSTEEQAIHRQARRTGVEV